MNTLLNLIKFYEANFPEVTIVLKDGDKKKVCLLPVTSFLQEDEDIESPQEFIAFDRWVAIDKGINFKIET